MLGPRTASVNWPVLIAIVPKLTTAMSFCVMALVAGCFNTISMMLAILNA